jgi:3-phosphoshikimate 1-carboxyvinyltransferase
LHGCKICVPGDISSAAYFIVAASILPQSEILIKNVNVNHTRTGIIDVIKKMGGNIEIKDERVLNNEPVADIIVKSSCLKGIEIGGEIIPRLIDEIPIIAVAASYADGETVIKDAEELKVKESNRIDTMVSELKKMGADIEATSDGMIIHGKETLNGALVDSYNDHRVAMSLSIAALKAEGSTKIKNAECVNISFPDFYSVLNVL